MYKLSSYILLLALAFVAGCSKDRLISKYVQKMQGDHYWHGITISIGNPSDTSPKNFNSPILVVDDKTIFFPRADTMKLLSYDKKSKKIVFTSSHWSSYYSGMEDTIVYDYKSNIIYYESDWQGGGHFGRMLVQTP